MAFKIRHKETGLFLNTSRTKHTINPWRQFKTNLTKRGKVYEKITLQQAGGYYPNYYDTQGKVVEFNINDFELVTV